MEETKQKLHTLAGGTLTATTKMTDNIVPKVNVKQEVHQGTVLVGGVVVQVVGVRQEVEGVGMSWLKQEVDHGTPRRHVDTFHSEPAENLQTQNLCIKEEFEVKNEVQVEDEFLFSEQEYEKRKVLECLTNTFKTEAKIKESEDYSIGKQPPEKGLGHKRRHTQKKEGKKKSLTHENGNGKREASQELLQIQASEPRDRPGTDLQQCTMTGQERILECLECGNKFSTWKGWKLHQKANIYKILNLNHYECVECKKQFCSKNSLAVHTKLHTGEKNFACPVCNKRFVQKGNMLQHARVHKHEHEGKLKYKRCWRERRDKKMVEVSRYARLQAKDMVIERTDTGRDGRLKELFTKGRVSIHVRVSSAQK